MSQCKLFILALCLLFMVGCNPQSSVDAAQPGGSQKQVVDHDAVLKLEELTDANSEELLLKRNMPSFVVVYSSKESNPAQTQQLEQIVRDSHNYAGAVNFYRLDQAKYPNTWSNITNGRSWSQGPCFLLFSINPVMIGTVMEQQNGIDVPVHNMSSARMSAEIARFMKIKPLVTHANLDNVDPLVIKPALPTFIMAYRSRGPHHDFVQFQRFVYESQLYAGRVNFVYVDLDQPDLSSKLGIALPKQDDVYYVLYNPKSKTSQTVADPALSGRQMETVISKFFGPGHEPAKVIY